MWRIDVEVEVVFSLTRIRNQDPRDQVLKVRLGLSGAKVKSQVQSSPV